MHIPNAHLSALLLSICLPLTSSTSIPLAEPEPKYIFANPENLDESTNRIPTSRESAVMARRILHLTPLGTISTVFPNTTTTTHPSENRPSHLSNLPIGLMDYIGDCEPSTNNPTILAISIATSFKNAISHPNISLSLSWTPPYPPKSRISSSPFSTLLNWLRGEDDEPDPYAYSAANLPRFSLLGYLEPIPISESSPESEDTNKALGQCFVNTHPDSKYWLPGNRIHHSEWRRLVVTGIYWVGGFGDRAYIGWIPIEEWRSVEREEWEAIRLAGEKKGWREWAVEGLGGVEL